MTALPKPFQHRSYILNVLIGVDELVNALIGGSPHETLSSHAWRDKVGGSKIASVAVFLIDALFWPWQKRHCRKAYAVAMDRALTISWGLS